MRLAVAMAERGLGLTAPNPSVGAVLVRYDMHPQPVVAGRGWTQPGGRPHAETMAMRAAGEAARGATLYVTLEPCSHHGKTPPCAEAVIAAGVARVMVGVPDPDPRVSGRGLAMLRAAGLEVVVGLEQEACQRVTQGHILRLTERRPAVLIKQALDQHLAVPKGGQGRPNFVTNPEARALGHLHRAQSDAIVVGSGTVRDDDPDLTCRLPGMANHSPIRIVLDGRLDALTPVTKLACTARQTPVWVITSGEAPQDKRAALEALGVRVCVLEAIGSRPSLRALMPFLADAGITRLMVEGGPGLWRAFTELGLFDEAIILVQRGGGPIERPTYTMFHKPVGPTAMILTDRGNIGGDLWFQFRRRDDTPRV
jgi:diaminohydroxyphosphoribosylaminopyrimidine deaminase/5-amino-6-(5-phosphoribosylamino)uracil reductase